MDAIKNTSYGEHSRFHWFGHIIPHNQRKRKRKNVTEREKFLSMAAAARAMDARFYAAPFGDRLNGTDVTEAVMRALEIAGRERDGTTSDVREGVRSRV